MSGFEQNQQITTAQQQTMVLSARQQLGLEMLTLPLIKLEEKLQEELLKNPALEELPPESPALPEPPDTAEKRDDDDYESGFEAELSRQEEWANELPLPPEVNDSGEDRKFDLLSNSPAPAPTLREMLMIEAETADIPEQLRELVFEIISSLDPDGFLTVSPADLLMNCMSFQENSELDETDMEKALAIVRKLAPPGVSAQRRSDFLKEQLAVAGKLDDSMAQLCEELEEMPDEFNKETYLELLSARMNLPESEIKKMLSVLHELDLPVFSSSATVSETEFIHPELEIELLPDGKLQVNQLRGGRRKFGVSPVYEEMLEKKSLSRDDRKYLTEKIAEAKDYIKALAMRESTLLRLGELIALRQREFFTGGIACLKNFTMSEAAVILGHDASTITRAVQNKYVRTPQGVLPLRFFFPGGSRSAADENRSQPAIMEEIRQMIANENPALPLSDEQIARQLNRNGVKIERRTVAKYRTKMDILPAGKRKG